MLTFVLIVTLSVTFCNDQNILVKSAEGSVFPIITNILTQLGYPYKLIVDVPLTSNDFIGIDLLVETTISMDDTCSNISRIQYQQFKII